MSLEQKQADRLAILKALYEKTDGDIYRQAECRALAAAVGIPEDRALPAADYLNREGLAKWSLNHVLSITHLGLKEVEAALSYPSGPTEHFPAPIIQHVINVQNMHGSAIMQGSPGASQTVTNNHATPEVLEQLRKLVAQIRERADSIESLPADDRSDLKADAATAQAQLEKKSPDTGVLRPVLNSMKGVLIKAASSELARLLTEQIDKLLPLLSQGVP